MATPVSNQPMKPPARLRIKFSVFATTPWISSRCPATLVRFASSPSRTPAVMLFNASRGLSRALSRPSRRFPICSILVRPIKTTLRSTLVAMIFSAMLLSSGCEEKTDATDPTAQSTPGSTKALEAADLVGYDGKMLRKSVDRIKEGNEKHNQELEKTAGSGPDQ
jgi:hypothetical protein